MKKNLFDTYNELINSLTNAQKKQPELNELNEMKKGLELFIEHAKTIEFVDETALGYLELFSQKIDMYDNDRESLGEAIELCKKVFLSLNVAPPEMIFLLTAPFDEDAKTGDGQYAESLVTGFEQHARETPCVWLKGQTTHDNKKNEGPKAYTLKLKSGLQSIPPDTIPSVYVLQPVANGHTVLSGYQCPDDGLLKVATRKIQQQVTLRTPKIVLDKNKKLHCIAYQGTDDVVVITAQQAKDRIKELSDLLKVKMDMRQKDKALSKTISQYKDLLRYCSTLCQQSAQKNEIDKNLPSSIKKINELRQNIPHFSHMSALALPNTENDLAKLLESLPEQKAQIEQSLTKLNAAADTYKALLEHCKKLRNALTETGEMPDDASQSINEINKQLQSTALFSKQPVLQSPSSEQEKETFLNTLQKLEDDIQQAHSVLEEPIWEQDELLKQYTKLQDNLSKKQRLSTESTALIPQINDAKNKIAKFKDDKDLSATNEQEMDILIHTVQGLKGEMQQELASLERPIPELREAIQSLKNLAADFDAAEYNNSRLIQTINQLSGITRRTYDYEHAQLECEKKEPQRKEPESTAQAFAEALHVASQDEERIDIISQLVASMEKLADGKHCALDIHIRPPDTGIFVMPEDIKRFKEAGLQVNITIHEYKQNYTRRFLQQFTHMLLIEADSVLFFNEKDRKNAFRAARDGDAGLHDQKNGFWIVEPRYNLEEKSGLTVASQNLSGTPMTPEEVIQKEPNIISFGTIRPGKGFEEALEIAIQLKKEAQQDKEPEHKWPFMKVIMSGDPQDKQLMTQIFTERYGKSALETYQRKAAYSSTEEQDPAARRVYWATAKDALEKTHGTKLNNPHVEIYPWSSKEELAQLKKRCKYVCRMDDMGMRNNGSAIISVLDVGIVYTKWGSVTDKYYTETSRDEDGECYVDAVDLGDQKYGQNSAHTNPQNNEWNEAEKIQSPYKRLGNARPASTILTSIVERELDQKKYADEPEKSRNYRTVVAAQTLLTKKFTLKNSVRNLQKVFMLKHQETLQLRDIATIEEQTLETVTTQKTRNKSLVQHQDSMSITEVRSTMFSLDRAIKAKAQRVQNSTQLAESSTPSIAPRVAIRVSAE